MPKLEFNSILNTARNLCYEVLYEVVLTFNACTAFSLALFCVSMYLTFQVRTMQSDRSQVWRIQWKIYRCSFSKSMYILNVSVSAIQIYLICGPSSFIFLIVAVLRVSFVLFSSNPLLLSSKGYWWCFSGCIETYEKRGCTICTFVSLFQRRRKGRCCKRCQRWSYWSMHYKTSWEIKIESRKNQGE